jgi:hypothetical protein
MAFRRVKGLSLLPQPTSRVRQEDLEGEGGDGSRGLGEGGLQHRRFAHKVWFVHECIISGGACLRADGHVHRVTSGGCQSC